MTEILHKLAAEYGRKIEEILKGYGKIADGLNGITLYKNHKMKKDTARKFKELELVLEKVGYKLLITSTTTGKHKDPAHKEGDAIDFKVYRDGKEITIPESVEIENICQENGWKVYNEYVKSSEYKTGPHIHITHLRKR